MRKRALFIKYLITLFAEAIMPLLMAGVFLFLPKSVLAQSFPFRQYKGLPQSEIVMFCQEKAGFIWIATRNGVSRFDGTEFVNYYHKDGLENCYNIHCIFEDYKGQIWVLANASISKYTGKGFVSYDIPAEFQPVEFGFQTTWNDSSIICLSAASNKVVSFKNGIFSDLSITYPSLSALDIESIVFDTELNTMIVKENNKKLWSVNMDGSVNYLTDNVDQLFAYKGEIYVRKELLYFTLREGKVMPFRYWTVKGIPYTDITILNTSRSFPLNLKSERLVVHTPFPPTNYFEDSGSVVWISSGNSLFRLTSTAFRIFSDEFPEMNKIWAIVEDRNGHIWFGSIDNNLYEFDGTALRKRNDYKYLFPPEIAFYKGSRQMSNGDIWFSTNYGVLIWNGTSFSKLQGAAEKDQVCYIFEDPVNKLSMIGTDKGLYRIEQGNVTFYPEFNDANLGVIEGICRDGEDTYLLSGHHGIVILRNGKAEPLNERILPDGYTFTVLKDERGGIWLTSDEGLYFRRSPSDEFIHALPEKINSAANSVVRMDSSTILIGRVNDVVTINTEEFYANDDNYYRIYDESDGFTGTDCLDNGLIKDSKGRIWILTSEKVVILDSKKLVSDTSEPYLNITGLFYQTDSLTWISADSTLYYKNLPANINLKSSMNNIRIEYTAISTRNPEKIIYRYRLMGYDDVWSLPTERRFIVYDKLPPGQYTFQIMAKNADGKENSVPKEISFRIVPSIWQTKLFRILSILAELGVVISITILIIKNRHRKQREKELMKSKLSRLQMNSILNQFDPHFTFNVISSVGSFIMKGERETAYDYITKLSALLRTVLSDGTVIVRPLADEIDFVRKYCELQKLRFNERFICIFSIDEGIDLLRPLPKMAIQIFVENAIKHGFEQRVEGGILNIEITEKDSDLTVTVRDNGIGRDAAARFSSGRDGQGIRIIKGIFDHMNESNDRKAFVKVVDLYENGIAAGTEVKIFIPHGFRFDNSNFGKRRRKRLFGLKYIL